MKEHIDLSMSVSNAVRRLSKYGVNEETQAKVDAACPYPHVQRRFRNDTGVTVKKRIRKNFDFNTKKKWIPKEFLVSE